MAHLIPIVIATLSLFLAFMLPLAYAQWATRGITAPGARR